MCPAANPASTIVVDGPQARKIWNSLLDRPSAPGLLSHVINVGTSWLLDWLTEEYLAHGLADGDACFKYVQGYYGSGKTQFIQSLAARAARHGIASAVIDVGQSCPFNSQLAIYQAVMRHLRPPAERGRLAADEKGIEILVDAWVAQKLAERGIEPGHHVSEGVVQELLSHFNVPLSGFPDVQAATAMRLFCRRRVEIAGGAVDGAQDSVLLAWLRGNQVSDSALKTQGIHEPAKELNAFNRLKTVLGFLRRFLGSRGFLIAFDEGSRTASFRRGSTNQENSVENLLTMCNDVADMEFASVMFVYSATPDFRSEVVTRYQALNDRIGNHSVQPGRLETRRRPFIDLDALDTDSIVLEMGQVLLQIFEAAYSVELPRDIEVANVRTLLAAEKRQFGIGSEIRRAFVYHYCALLEDQKYNGARVLSAADMEDFIAGRPMAFEDEAA